MDEARDLTLLGFASGIAASNVNCALGPWHLYYHPEWFESFARTVHWGKIIELASALRGEATWPVLTDQLMALAEATCALSTQSRPFCVIGGDHSAAIGTWSGVSVAHRSQGHIGLIWIDAHMDSHTPETSLTQNVHGMPVAHLLGQGISTLCQLLDNDPKIKSEHLCLIGVRSYEAAEAQFLRQQGVRVYFMDEVIARGIDVVLQEAWDMIALQTCGIGMSIDLDGFDPNDVPGVGNPEIGGLAVQPFLSALTEIRRTRETPFLGLEITEYNPLNDRDAKTAQVILALLQAVYPN